MLEFDLGGREWRRYVHSSYMRQGELGKATESDVC